MAGKYWRGVSVTLMLARMYLYFINFFILNFLILANFTLKLI